VVAFASETCPPGWTEYQPAYGRFIRGIDKGPDNEKNDPDGQRSSGAIQDDAIQNIKGKLYGVHGFDSDAHSWGFRPGTDGALVSLRTLV